MKRGIALLLSALLPFLSGCFTSQPTAEDYHDRVKPGMDQNQVQRTLGTPKEVHPIPGQGDSPDLPVEQWSYAWSHQAAQSLTIVITLFIGLIWMDRNPYGFDVGFGRDGRVRTISEVGKRPR